MALGWYGNKPVALVSAQRLLKSAGSSRFLTKASNMADALVSRTVRLATKTPGQAGQALYKAVDNRMGASLRQSATGRSVDSALKAVTHDLGTAGVKTFNAYNAARKTAVQENLFGDLKALAAHKHMTGVGATSFANRLVFSGEGKEAVLARLDDDSLRQIDALLSKDYQRVDALAAKGGKRLGQLYMSRTFAKSMVSANPMRAHNDRVEMFSTMAQQKLDHLKTAVKAEMAARSL
ncbi:hypothetical protein C882_1319 [Caenispirillum salinarum AK4]|uniref:Uncharacterized protein n=1 Tax=Caenispirillum salinarum AK4 TaxID=1238182 RepID=K9GSK9_9PROT|nr:hypothetical protein [Caenispirillum salinarum]EKV27724.1 hypothetical protein C882_1319 [Caenispirillum salinarum AK4]